MNAPQLPGRLHYAHERELSIRRHKNGEQFQYVDRDGKKISDSKTLERIQSLVIPPAWEKVRISSSEWGHIQAVGFDERGRKQYLYHPKWQELQQQHKFDKIVTFGAVLPELREKVTSDMRMKSLSKDRVIATAVWMLEHTFIRVGNKTYADQNQSYGLTTLREKHVIDEGDHLALKFKGKSGVSHLVDIDNPRVVRTIKQCIELPGYEIFKYIDENGKKHALDSDDVNEYMKGVTGEEFSAKDFRTWGGTVLAAKTLSDLGKFESPTAFKKNVNAAVKEVSQHLRNTVAVCRSYYIHPAIVETYEKDILVPYFAKNLAEAVAAKSILEPEEHVTWTLLQKYAS